MKSITKWLVVLALVVLAVNAFAIPAKPRPTTLAQPDGSTFTAVLKGDEHFSFAEDMDGYSLKQDNDGWWTYANQENGLLVPTSFKAGQVQCPYAPHLRPNSEAISKLPENANKMINVSAETRDVWAKNTLYGVGGTKEHPTKAAAGRQYVNVLLGDFTDSTFAWYSNRQRLASNPYGPFPYGVDAADDNPANLRWFNFLTIGDSSSPFSPDSSIVGSLSNFYFDFTYRKCWWYGTVALGSSGRTRVQANTATSTTYFQGAVTACDAAVNYYQGGSMNGLIVVHPGPGEEESGDVTDIWSASYTGISLTNADGGNITRGIACPQNAQLGVFAHEMFHQVGGPDLYDYGYSGTPYGEWSLMDNGSWNGIVEGGDSPAFPGAFLTYDINGFIHTGIDGWLTQTDSISSAKNGDGEYTIAALDSSGEDRRGNVTSGVRLWRIRNNAFRDSGQTYFVELRNRTSPYERGFSENGLIITHIDTRMSGGTRFNDGPPNVHYYYAWVENPGNNPNLTYALWAAVGDSANGAASFPRNPSNACYSANDISSGGYTENAIDSLTIPNCKTNKGAGNGGGNGPWIYDISAEGPYMTFKVARTGLAAATPLVGYNAATVKDPIIGGMANNNNSMLDPWEEDSIIVSLRNQGTAITAGAACSLYVIDGGAGNWVTIKIPLGWKTVGGGAIAQDGSGVSLATTINISKDVPKFTDIVFGYKFRSTTPAYTTDGQFTLRVSGFNIVKVYDFVNVAPQGTSGFANRIQPCDIAVYRDTLYVANAQLNLATWGTRIYKVKLNTTNNPLLTSDTVGSLNNMVSSHNGNKYCGGIDVDNSGKLWWTCQDSVFGSNRNNVRVNSFRAPNVSWGGSPMKRVRGLGIGPLTVDTVGADCMPGDSVMLYFQNYFDGAYAGSGAESLWVTNRIAGVGLGIRTKAWSFSDQAWGATSYGVNGYSWWNGRALDYDGGNVWTSSVWQNILMRRNVTASGTTAPILETMPGPSSYGSYGTYGVALESTDSLGVQYAPAGTVTYVRGVKGTRHYMYCAAMDEGKVYKVDITGWMLPTPPDSQKVVDTGSDNVITWWKSNVDVQKIPQYIVYRQAPGATTPPTAADELARVQHVYGAGISNTYTDVGGGTKGAKAAYVYSIKSVNFYGEGSWGASVNASPLAVEEVNFTSAPVNNGVTLEWATVSGYNSYKWVIKRSTDDQDYQVIATVPGSAPSPYGQKYSYTDQVETAGIYYYQLYDGNGTLKGKLSAAVGKVPLNYELSQNCPNPVGRGSTHINFALKNPGKTTLKVYNVLGEETKSILKGEYLNTGFYIGKYAWDGTDNKGQQVSNGIYFYKLISGDFQSTKKLTVLK